jgi:hypothetical protein
VTTRLNIYIFFFFLTTACAQHSNTGIAQPSQAPAKNSSPSLPTKPVTKAQSQPQSLTHAANNNSAMIQRLVAKQSAHFPAILKELRNNKKKTSHWVWWVFPTEKAGASEDEPKTMVDVSMVDALLREADLNSWSEIIEEIFSLLKAEAFTRGWKESGGNKPDSAIIPRIDHNRINYALLFWLKKVKDKTQKYPRFYSALKNLSKFDWKTK